MTNRFSALQPADFEDDIFGAPESPPPAPSSEQGQATDGEEPSPAPQPKPAEPVAAPEIEVTGNRKNILEAKKKLHRKMLDEFNLGALEKMYPHFQ